MNSKIIICIISSLFIALSTNAQKEETLLSKIFFDVDVSKADTRIITEFKTNSELKFIQYGWTAYPPLSNNNDTPKIYSFDFQKNKFFSNSFDSGSLDVLTRKNKSGTTLDYVMLGVATHNIAAGDSTFNSLGAILTQYSSKKWKEKGVSSSYTLMHFINKSKTKKVVLTRYKSIADSIKSGVRISIQMIYLK